MRILIFIPYLIGGGAQRVVVNLLKELKDEDDLNIKLIVIDKEGPFKNKIPDEVEIIELNKNRVLFSILELRQLFIAEKPDIIFSHLNYANIISVIAAKLARIDTKILVTEHNNYNKENETSFKRFLFTLAMKITYRFATRIITVSDGVAESLKRAGLKGPKYNYKTIYNPVVDENLKNKKAENINVDWFEDRDTKVVLGVGSLSKQKNFSELIRCFGKVKKELTGAKLIILGKGKKRNELENLISKLNLEEHISMPGFVDNPYAYMDKADVFALTSLWEGFGNVIVEAMACGCPVVSYSCPYGPNEIIKSEVNGVLVPVGDEVKLTQKIIEVLKDKDYRIKLSKNALKRAEDFSTSKISGEYKEIFCELTT